MPLLPFTKREAYLYRANPHTRIAATPSARTEARQRRADGIPAFKAVHGDRREVGPGADGAVDYRDGTPLTTYQLQARGNQERVTAHYTSSFKSEVFVERCVTSDLLLLLSELWRAELCQFLYLREQITVVSHFPNSSSPALRNSIHPIGLPEILRRDDFLSNIFGSGGASGYYRGAFGRYDKNDLFATILTSLRPAKKNGFCIHPEVSLFRLGL